MAESTISKVEDFKSTVDNWSRGQGKYPWTDCTEPGLGFKVYGRTINQVSAACAASRQSFMGWKFSCKTIKKEDGTTDYIRVIRIS